MLHLCQLLLISKTRKVPHQSTKSCGPGITLPRDKCSDNITAKTIKRYAVLNYIRLEARQDMHAE